MYELAESVLVSGGGEQETAERASAAKAFRIVMGQYPIPTFLAYNVNFWMESHDRKGSE